jgi:hypothetical protein
VQCASRPKAAPPSCSGHLLKFPRQPFPPNRLPGNSRSLSSHLHNEDGLPTTRSPIRINAALSSPQFETGRSLALDVHSVGRCAGLYVSCGFKVFINQRFAGFAKEAASVNCHVRLPVAGLSRCRQRSGPSCAIHSPPAIPNLYAGIIAGGEQTVCTGLRLAIARARDHMEFCDTVGRIEETVPIGWHGAPAARAASPRQAAHSRKHTGLPEYGAPLSCQSRVNSTPALPQMGGCTSTAAGVRMTLSIEGGFHAVSTQEGERRLALVRELQRLAQGAR